MLEKEREALNDDMTTMRQQRYKLVLNKEKHHSYSDVFLLTDCNFYFSFAYSHLIACVLVY